MYQDQDEKTNYTLYFVPQLAIETIACEPHIQKLQIKKSDLITYEFL